MKKLIVVNLLPCALLSLPGHATVVYAAGDIADNRPPLSRWHPDYAEPFKKWLQE